MPLTISENATFRVDAGGRAEAVLRVHRPGYHTADEIRSELAWTEALQRAGAVATASPLSLGGMVPATVVVAGARFDVSAFSYLRGKAPSPGTPLGPAFGRLGALTARLHAHATGWTPPSYFRRGRWDWKATLGAAPVWGDWRDASGLGADERAVIERAIRRLAGRLAGYGMGADRFGLIHADLRLANLLDDGERLAAIDFDDCGWGWFVYDFAGSVSFMEDDARLPALMAAWCEGYAGVRPLGAVDRAMLWDMVLLRRLMLLGWLETRAGSDTAERFRPGFAKGTVRLATEYLCDGVWGPVPSGSGAAPWS